jgi:hypothetical protein
VGHELVEAREVEAGQRDRLALRRSRGDVAEQPRERAGRQAEREPVDARA